MSAYSKKDGCNNQPVFSEKRLLCILKFSSCIKASETMVPGSRTNQPPARAGHRPLNQQEPGSCKPQTLSPDTKKLSIPEASHPRNLQASTCKQQPASIRVTNHQAINQFKAAA
jgi:hypothetical protein